MVHESEQYTNICKARFDAISGSDKEVMAILKQIDIAIRGNGEPGIKQRLDRLERFDKVWAKLGWLFVGAGAVMLLMHFFG